MTLCKVIPKALLKRFFLSKCIRLGTSDFFHSLLIFHKKTPMKQPTLAEVARMIDHALLHPMMTDREIRQGCELAKKYGVATACVKPYSIPLALEVLAGSKVLVCPVIAFPHGNSKTSVKVHEATEAARDGGREIDMVINIGKALSGDWTYVSDEIKAVNEACLSNGSILKVIFENDYLADADILRLCEICSSHAVAFVKTSTGFGFVRQPNGLYSYKGATDHHLELMRRHCPPTVRLKASGGLKTLEDLLRVRALGVERCGTSSTEAILQEAQKVLGA